MIAIILGTRPEIIKLATIIKALQKKNIAFIIIHTNQHYDWHLDRVFFEQLGLPEPDFRIAEHYTSSCQQVGTMLLELEKILLKIKPDLVVVQGDTNSAQAGALAASKLFIPIAHVEAGLRSYDDRMPEEWNRIICDHLSSLLFAPTAVQETILLNEGIPRKKIYVVGNTIVDAVLSLQKFGKSAEEAKVLEMFEVKKQQFIIVTLHRAENVDDAKTLKSLFFSLKKIYEKYKIPLLFPVHPRTEKRIIEQKIQIPEGVKLMKPIGYFDFLVLEKNAQLIITDAGGIQEEACIFHVPCVTLRKSTERPETVTVGANMVAGTDPNRIAVCAETMIHKKREWENPFGNGTAGEQIVDICHDFIERKKGVF